jgi:hypothetical protein
MRRNDLQAPKLVRTETQMQSGLERKEHEIMHFLHQNVFDSILESSDASEK